MKKDIVNREEFRIVLISLFGLDFGVYALDSFIKLKGYSPHIIEFNHLKIPAELVINDYFTMGMLKHDLFPEKDLHLLLELLANIRPQLIGISVSSVCFRTATWITREIKKHFAIPVVWGGIHAIISPEDCIRETAIVCTGEGEHAFYDIVERIRNKEPLSGIKNTWIRSGDKIEKNPMRGLILDLDSLPYPDRFDGKNKYFIDKGKIINNPVLIASYVINAYPMMTSRGCMYACSFCCNSIIREKYRGLGPYLRRRSVDHVIGELRYAVQHGSIDSVRFWDDIFTYDEGWIDDFCDRYPYESGKQFVCYGHPRHTKYSVLEKLSQVGLILLFVGIQSGSKNTSIRLFNRKQTNAEIINFSKYARDLKISVNYDIIVDNCLENDQDNYYTSELLLSLPKPYRVIFYSLCFFPKTPLTNKALSDGIIEESDLEQLTSKAINNFFLFIQKSKDDYQIFWNCIKAMAINPHFSKSFIKFCRKNKFFKARPYFLFLLCRFWLQLFKQRGKKKQTNWLNQLKNDHAFLNDYLVYPGNKKIYQKNHNIYILFPNGEHNQQHSFCLRLNYNNTEYHRKDIIHGFQIELTPLKETSLVKRNIWRLRYPIALSGSKEVNFALEFPHLYCYVNNKNVAMMPLTLQDSLPKEKTPYVMKIKLVKQGNFIPFKLNKILIAKLLCLLRAS